MTELFLTVLNRGISAGWLVLALLILLDATWQRIVGNREKGIRTWVFVDEMQLLFQNEEA